MPYKLLLSEEISPAIKRIAIEQLTKARKEISAADNIHAGVHKTRTALKRTRALLRLARPVIGEEIFKSENRTYRDLARALARPRDAGAMLETIVKFEAREDLQHYAPLFLQLKSMIELEKNEIESELEVVSLAALLETLDGSLKKWHSMTLEPASFERLAHGFGLTYERGRRDLEIALGHSDSYYLHEWRKTVQQTWRHLQILTLIWPEDVMPRITLAREISKLLGAEHDITELLNYMKLHKKQFCKKARQRRQYKSFRQTAKAIQRDLCLHAIERGRRLYAFDSIAISKAMTVYWKSSRAMQPMPSMVLEIAQIGVEKNPALMKMRGQRAQSGKSSPPLRNKDDFDHTLPAKTAASDHCDAVDKKSSKKGDQNRDELLRSLRSLDETMLPSRQPDRPDDDEKS